MYRYSCLACRWIYRQLLPPADSTAEEEPLELSQMQGPCPSYTDTLALPADRSTSSCCRRQTAPLRRSLWSCLRCKALVLHIQIHLPCLQVDLPAAAAAGRQCGRGGAGQRPRVRAAPGAAAGDAAAADRAPGGRRAHGGQQRAVPRGLPGGGRAGPVQRPEVCCNEIPQGSHRPYLLDSLPSW